MGWIRTADQKVIDLYQDGYNYLWDRWGIYIGQVSQLIVFVLFGYNMLLPIEQSTTVGQVVCIITTLILLAYYEYRNYCQKAALFDLINQSARVNRTFLSLRIIFISVFLLPSMVIQILDGQFFQIIWSVAFFLFLYCDTPMVRDRDESRFKQFSCAPQGA